MASCCLKEIVYICHVYINPLEYENGVLVLELI